MDFCAMRSISARSATSILVAVLAAMVGTACTDSPDRQPFRMRLEFASQNGGPRVCRSTCSAYPLDCRGRMSVRIADAEDPEEEYDFRCVDTLTTGTMCALSEVEVALKPLPLGMARVEVAVWRADVLQDGECLREPIFDLQGEPLVTVEPQPAVAGATFVDIGSDRIVQIPMACTFPEQMEEASCPFENQQLQH